MKNILTAILLFATMTASAQLPSYVPTANLVTYYAFDNVDSTADLSGNGNDGARYGTVQHDSDKCTIDSNSYTFNNVSAGIVRSSVDTTTFHNFSSGLTISLWGYIPELAPLDTINRLILGYGSFKLYTEIRNLHGAIPKDYLVFTNGVDSISIHVSNHVPSGADWFNYTVTVFTDSIRVYLNGIFYDGIPVTTLHILDAFTDGNLYIGGHLTNTDTSNLFYGNIDNVAIYNRAITTTEVNDLYYSCPTLAVDNVVSAKKNIYPIPANNSLTIEGNTGDLYNIIGATGRAVKTVKTGTIDVSDIPNGMYIVTNGVTNTKIVIAH